MLEAGRGLARNQGFHLWFTIIKYSLREKSVRLSVKVFISNCDLLV
jgi:hypothetical protein